MDRLRLAESWHYIKNHQSDSKRQNRRDSLQSSKDGSSDGTRRHFNQQSAFHHDPEELQLDLVNVLRRRRLQYAQN